ncbi:hypothetical protein [Streptosporangium sp. NPDC049304]|uniref:hypothetical protein n=1 Tax=Streptosporangium sp. NPDC049304 TaxID=3154830 RepID=UPI003429411B
MTALHRRDVPHLPVRWPRFTAGTSPTSLYATRLLPEAGGPQFLDQPFDTTGDRM